MQFILVNFKEISKIMNFMNFYLFWNVFYEFYKDLAKPEVKNIRDELKKYGNENP